MKMVVPPTQIANLGLSIVSATIRAGPSVNSFFTARSSADEHMAEYNRAKGSMSFWEYLAEEHSRARNRNERARSSLISAFADLRASFSDYEKQVTKWNRCVGSDFTDTTECQSTLTKGHVVQPIAIESEKTAAEGGPRRKRIAPVSRAKYAFSGDKKIARCAARYRRNEKILFAYISALASTFGQIDVPNIPSAPGAVPALIRFIALAKKRVETNADIVIIEGANRSKYQLSNDRFLIDPKTGFTKLYELAIQQGDLRLKEGDESVTGLQTYENCIIVKRSGGSLEESLNLARLFAEDPADKFSRGFFSDPPDGAMLRCCAVFCKNSECDILFRTPEGCSLQTLRQLLPTSSNSGPSVSKADRAKFSIRLATSVLVVHSLGLVHKRIHPETILVADKQLHLGNSRRCLGYPYLAAFQGVRSDVGISLKKSEVDAYILRGIYFHPRDQCESEYRAERYSMEDDIYSLGVCLFEIALWRSLLIWNEEAKDYVYDDSFIPLSDRKVWPGATLKDRAKAKLEMLVTEANKRIPDVLGHEFAEVVVSCLTVGYDANPLRKVYDTFRDEDVDDPVALKYLELVLSKLRCIHELYEK